MCSLLGVTCLGHSDKQVASRMRTTRKACGVEPSSLRQGCRSPPWSPKAQHEALSEQSPSVRTWKLGAISLAVPAADMGTVGGWQEADCKCPAGQWHESHFPSGSSFRREVVTLPTAGAACVAGTGPPVPGDDQRRLEAASLGERGGFSALGGRLTSPGAQVSARIDTAEPQ